jgi:hypothetical protein
VITVKSRIKSVKRHSRLKSARKKDPKDDKSEVIEEHEDLGWGILIEGLSAWIIVGPEEPDLRESDEVTITISRRKT